MLDLLHRHVETTSTMIYAFMWNFIFWPPLISRSLQWFPSHLAFFFSFHLFSASPRFLLNAHTKKDECHASYFLLITSVHLEAFSGWLMLRQQKWNIFLFLLPLGMINSFWWGLVLPSGTLQSTSSWEKWDEGQKIIIRCDAWRPDIELNALQKQIYHRNVNINWNFFYLISFDQLYTFCIFHANQVKCSCSRMSQVALISICFYIWVLGQLFF